MAYLAPTFSIAMLANPTVENSVLIEPITVNDLPDNLESAIAKPNLAAVISQAIGREIVARRQPIRLAPGDVLFVAQYTGPRLGDDERTMPHGGVVRLFRVTVM